MYLLYDRYCWLLRSYVAGLVKKAKSHGFWLCAPLKSVQITAGVVVSGSSSPHPPVYIRFSTFIGNRYVCEEIARVGAENVYSLTYESESCTSQGDS